MAVKQSILPVCGLFLRLACGHVCENDFTSNLNKEVVSLLQTSADTGNAQAAMKGRRLAPRGGYPDLFMDDKSQMVNCTDAYGFKADPPCLDVNGRVCLFCPQPGPQYPQFANAIVRDDCGNQSGMDKNDLDRPLVTYTNPPSANFLPPKTGPPQSWTNAFCELNLGTTWINADVNRDYMYYAVTWVTEPGFDFDSCWYNGFLDDDIAKHIHDYDWMYERAAAVCAELDQEFNLSGITMRGYYDPPPLSDPKWVRWVTAMHCAGGASPGGDMAWCSYAYKHLGGGHYCHPRGRFKGTKWEGTPEEKEWECPGA